MKKLIWTILLMLYSSIALSMENKDLLAGIGFVYTPTEAGVLGFEYNCQLLFDRDTKPESDYPFLNYYDYYYARLSKPQEVDRIEIENSLLISYTPINRISLFTNIPFVYKNYRYEYDGDDQVSDLGDILVATKIQITESNEDIPLVNFILGYRFKGGKSPYELDPQEEIATSRGYNSYIGGVTISKRFNPVTPFCNLQYSYNLTEKVKKNFMVNCLKKSNQAANCKWNSASPVPSENPFPIWSGLIIPILLTENIFIISDQYP